MKTESTSELQLESSAHVFPFGLDFELFESHAFLFRLLELRLQRRRLLLYGTVTRTCPIATEANPMCKV